MAKRGNEITDEADRRYRADRDTFVNTTICGRCGQSFDGPLGETRPAFAAHLRRDHPEVQPRKKATRARARGFGQLSSKSLDQNIQNTRAQGGADWVAAE